MIETLRLCNFADTIEGIVFLRGLIWVLDKLFDTEFSHNRHAKNLRWFLRIVELSTYIDDIVDLSIIMQGWAEHHDNYNKGKIQGKALKIAVQMYLDGALQSIAEKWVDVSIKHNFHHRRTLGL